MTVNKKNRSITYLSVVLSLCVSCPSLFAVGKNILRIHFQTAMVKPGTTDIVLNAYYKIQASRPYTFTGFDYAFNYEQTAISPIQAFYDGTACANAALAIIHGNDPAHQIYHVIVDNTPQSLDTTNPVLFQIWYQIGAIGDSAMIAPIKFDVGSNDGIDSVVIDNATWDPKFLWHPFGLLFPDTTKPPPQKKFDVILSSDTADIRSDSIKIVSIQASLLDSAKINSAVFAFDIDTSAFDSVTILRGSLLGNAAFSSFTVSPRDSTRITAKFFTVDSTKYLTGQGELLRILLRGKKITDTVCSMLRNPKLTVLNSNELVASVKYKLDGICILGIAATKGIVTSTSGNDPISIYPNPAQLFVNFVFSGADEKHFEVFDALGRKVFERISDATFRWDVATVPAGFYTMTVSGTVVSEKDSNLIEKQIFLIIH
jgi:hypothetical protein